MPIIWSGTLGSMIASIRRLEDRAEARYNQYDRENESTLIEREREADMRTLCYLLRAIAEEVYTFGDTDA